MRGEVLPIIDTYTMRSHGNEKKALHLQGFYAIMKKSQKITHMVAQDGAKA